MNAWGWQESKCTHWKISVSLKCVRTSRIECFFNRSPLYIHVFKNVISVSEISAVNFTVGWKLFSILTTWFTIVKEKGDFINPAQSLQKKKENKKWC